MSAQPIHSIDEITTNLAHKFPESLPIFKALVEWSKENCWVNISLHEYLVTGSIFKLREELKSVCKFGHYDEDPENAEQLNKHLTSIDQVFHEIGDTSGILDQMRQILSKRWPESLSLFDKMIDRSKHDSTYKCLFDTYLLHGSTFEVRDLTSKFGDYWGNDLAFRNDVNAIDATHAIILPYSLIKWEDEFKEFLPTDALLLMDSIIGKMRSDYFFDAKVVDYFSNGSIIKLRKLVESFGDLNVTPETIVTFDNVHQNAFN